MRGERVLDRNGVVLKVGDRVRFREATYYINTADGTGVIERFDRFGSVVIRTDQPWRRADRNGVIQESQVCWFCCDWDYERGCNVARRKLGDPFEHGRIDVFVEKVENANQ